MAVTEAMMQLFIKETVPLDRMRSAVKRFSSLDESGKENPVGPEEALLLWINKSAETLQKKAEKETKSDDEVSEYKGGLKMFVRSLPKVH
jgi:hypothetical protein